MKRTICIAPMMAYTDRHFRYLLRLISQYSVLYTEMITADAVIYGACRYLLDFSDREHPVAIQLGGSDPKKLAAASSIAAAWGYDEINLNVGCPSERVQHACFGAALMKKPKLVARCLYAMQDAVSIPITLKTRLGVDECDSNYFLQDFIGTIQETGCSVFILHARKAWLSGLSPKENRDIPPLQYERVYQIKKNFPDSTVILNGGITTYEQTMEHLQFVDGVMLGRVICANPYWLSRVDQMFYGDADPPKTRFEIVSAYCGYILKQYARGIAMHHLTRHLIRLFQGEQGAKIWRRALSETSSDDRQLLRAVQLITAATS